MNKIYRLTVHEPKTGAVLFMHSFSILFKARLLMKSFLKNIDCICELENTETGESITEVSKFKNGGLRP